MSDIKPYFSKNGKIPLRKAIEKRHLPWGARTVDFLHSCLSKTERALEKRRAK